MERQEPALKQLIGWCGNRIMVMSISAMGPKGTGFGPILRFM